MKISSISIKRPTLVVVTFTVVVFLGIFSYNQLKYELLPKFTPPIFSVATVYPGASSYEVEQSVSKKLEDALSSIEGLETIRTVSQQGVSMIILELNFNSDINWAIQDARQKIGAVRGDMPREIMDPIINKVSLEDLPILYMGAYSNQSPVEFYELVRRDIKPALSRLKGVANVNVSGGTEREIQVRLKRSAMENHRIPVTQVLQSIKASSMDFPAGKVENDEKRTMIRLSGKFDKIRDLEELVVSINPHQSPVKLKEVADICDGKKDLTSLTRINGKPAVGITVQKQTDANAVEVSRRVREEIHSLEDRYQHNELHFAIPKDTTDFTMEAADAVMGDLLNAIILVTLVMILFLHSFRNALIVMLSVPISLISAFLGMYLFDFTLNLMTLLALSLVVGILVDDAIVVLENVYRHLEMGKDKWQATLDGVREIGITVISTTLVLVVVFLPVALTQSIITPIINPFALVIVVSTLLSTLVALTVVPVLTSRFSRLEKIRSNTAAGHLVRWFEKRIEAFSYLIRRILVLALRHKPVTLIIATLLFIASLGLIAGGFIGNEFISLGDRGEFMLQVEMPADASLKHTNQLTRQAERIIFAHPKVTSVYTTVGATSDFFAIQGGANKAEIQVKLVDKSQRNKHSNLIAHELTEEIRQRIPGIRIKKAIANIAGGTDQSPVQLVIRSTNRDTLNKYAPLLLKKVSDIPGTTDTRLTIEGVNPEISVEIDKEKMAGLGVTMDQVGLTMQTAFSGNDDAQFIDGREQYNIQVTLDPFDRNNINDVQDLSFKNHMGQMVHLGQFADIQYHFTSNRQERYQRMPSITLESQTLGREAGVIGDDIAQMLNKTDLPDAIQVSFEGDLKYQEEAFGKLGFAFIASIFFVYLIMVALYDSYIYPFVVLFSIPLAIIGALLALALTQNALSLFSLLGMIMLIGIVAKNAILVVDFTNILKARGYGTIHALFNATRLRLRPILMTSVSLIIGLLPIALASGAGAEWKNGLAWVIIGGLTSSMLLTLVVVPVIYHLVDLSKEKVERLFKKPSA